MKTQFRLIIDPSSVPSSRHLLVRPVFGSNELFWIGAWVECCALLLNLSLLHYIFLWFFTSADYNHLWLISVC